MLSPSLEDYLEEIYRFSTQMGFVRITDIANKLDVSLPSVNKAVNILNDKGYLNYIPYKNIELTEKGLKLGRFLVERNRTLQEFLQVIGSNCNKEEEAEAIEHYLSRETVNAMTTVVMFFKERPDYQKELLSFQEEMRREEE
ncbi:MAG: iron dependent repressor, metal binding and dimerization domain protein [Halanaerobium sp.]|nr:iron dependent repressor, metal binding and dimerization domain protein [Halanaerobium sp.]